MKLYYYKDPEGNFGDDINPWLWPKLLPDLFDEDESKLFVGIGTILNNRLPNHAVKHVFGSGFGYGGKPNLNNGFVIHAVRGFETARALGIDENKVITDGAVLVRNFINIDVVRKTSKVGFMPTGHSYKNYDWELVCNELGYKFISCHWDVDRVLKEMLSCDLLLTEAMHGAIVADAIRVPWVPVNCYGYVLDFKWVDWLSTMGLPYEPRRITSLYNPGRSFGTAGLIKNKIKNGFKSFGVWSSSWQEPIPNASNEKCFYTAVRDMELAAKSNGYLSDDSVVNNHIDRYMNLLKLSF